MTAPTKDSLFYRGNGSMQLHICHARQIIDVLLFLPGCGSRYVEAHCCDDHYQNAAQRFAPSSPVNRIAAWLEIA
ncbi:hypothetical protein [Mesorhizobium sp.]|jgi:hypothetical protein|uniref:hypothetical protein n=1 Tax=Mesorhizobium sp. TaxID=1871066 RepID=UPI003561C904